MGIIVEKGRVRDPELMFIDLFELNKQPGSRKESKKDFLVKCILIFLFLMSFMSLSTRSVPSFAELFLIIMITLPVTISVSYSTSFLNRLFRNYGSISIMIILIMFVISLLAIEAALI